MLANPSPPTRRKNPYGSPAELVVRSGLAAPGRERHHVNGRNGGMSLDLRKRDLLRVGVARVGADFTWAIWL